MKKLILIILILSSGVFAQGKSEMTENLNQDIQELLEIDDKIQKLKDIVPEFEHNRDRKLNNV